MLPGTLIDAEGSSAEKIINALFEAGGLYLSQVCTITGLESHTVQNWVKRGFVSPPVKKMYSKRQFCRIAIINMLRDVLPLDTALKLLIFINKTLDDESDDRIDDSLLYLKFCSMISGNIMSDEKILSAAEALSRNIADKEIKRRLIIVLRTMYCAYFSAEYRKKAGEIISVSEIM